MDDGPLSKDFCEDEDVQEDFITNVLEECCACYEAKYEVRQNLLVYFSIFVDCVVTDPIIADPLKLFPIIQLTFEGLWSRNTHPKGFPRNGFLTKFGDIIGATHKIGTGY